MSSAEPCQKYKAEREWRRDVANSVREDITRWIFTSATSNVRPASEAVLSTELLVRAVRVEYVRSDCTLWAEDWVCAGRRVRRVIEYKKKVHQYFGRQI